MDNLHARTRSRCYKDDNIHDSPAAFLTPSEEIYSEIFAGFHGGSRGRGGASGIPFLDLPPVNEENETALFDYSEVFRGFEGRMVYAVSFHQLFRQSNAGHDARTPVETECLSEEWDGSSYSSKRKSYGNESNQQSVDDGNMSYQWKHLLNEGVSNTGHLAPVRAVPGYAVLIDQTAPSQKIELQYPHLAADDDDDSKPIERGRSEEKLAPNHETVEQEKLNVRNGSNDMYVTISEINLRTQPNDVPPPSRPPPIFDARYGNTSRTTSSARATCSSKHSSRSMLGNDSPPFVDVEVDGRFSAADFTPMKDSVMKSQATLKTIKESLQNRNVVMKQVSVCEKDETELNVAVRKSDNSVNGFHYASTMKSSNTSNSAQSSPDGIRQNPIFDLSGKRKSKRSWSMEESREARSSDEWGEVPEFIELVRSEKSKTHKQENGEYILAENGIVMEVGKEERRMPELEDKFNKRELIVSNTLEDHVNNSEAVSEVTTLDEKYKEVLASLQATDQCKEVEKNVYEEDQQLEDDIFIDLINNEHEIEKELNTFEQKVKFDEERKEDARKLLEVGPKMSFEDRQRVRKTSEIQLRNVNEQAHSEIQKDTHIKIHNERAMNIFIEEKQESCFKEAFEDEENFQEQKKSDEKEQKEKQLHETRRTSREISEKEENEIRQKEEEYVAKLMEASENEAEDMLKEALEEVNKRILMEYFERAEREKKMKNDAERTQNQESWRSSYMTPDADISIKATDHESCKTEKIREENIKVLNSVCESNQDSVRSAHEVIMVAGKKSNYKQSSDEGRTISECISGTGKKEQLSTTHESRALPNRTSMSSNSSGDAFLREDQIGIEINHEVPHMTPDPTNLQENVEVGNVTMMENAQAQTKVASHDGIDVSKDKLARKTDRKTAYKRSESTNSCLLDARKPTCNLSQHSKTSQIVGGKENCRNDDISFEERAKRERERRAREIELEHLREMEEEWEREREREKDRVAFESVARNVREGANAGSRERAAVNKATVAEARQKDLANARERLEKSCLEANEKLYSDKISVEVKMRQDQSAVKRANAEAHERADGSLTSIYNDGGLEGESTQRCKARLERQQRTAERVAKALTEKNTRDVIAQREQAERHRLAESLDGEVKRWANGKQGNLRALLSTLQYILGADSGWQPVPLTDIITSVDVKRAYRKATLCVHPDKLQQRRATIQQKYICEKIFDLLKEAWNRFNSDER